MRTELLINDQEFPEEFPYDLVVKKHRLRKEQKKDGLSRRDQIAELDELQRQWHDRRWKHVLKNTVEIDQDEK